MSDSQKKILILDEEGFSRVCSAILRTAGYGTDLLSHADELHARLKDDTVHLIVTSYPYGSFLLKEVRGRNIPTILLSDNVDSDLIDILKNCDNVYCMIKPLDYDHFKEVVSQLISGDITAQGGYRLV